jgi:hypothetical protein
MEDKVCGSYCNCFYGKDSETENLAESPTLIDFLDEIDNKNLLLELSPTLRKTWKICQSNFFSYFLFLTEDSDGKNEWIF